MGRQGVFRLLWRHEPYASAVDLCVSGASFCHYSADGVFIESDYRDACHLHLLGGVHDVVCIKKIYRPIQHLLGLFTCGEKKTWQASGQDEFKWIEKRWNDLSLESRKLQEQLLRQTPHMKKSFLQHLLQGDFYYDNEASLRSRMEEAGWSIGENVFQVLDLQVTGLRCEKASSEPVMNSLLYLR